MKDEITELLETLDTVIKKGSLQEKCIDAVDLMYLILFKLSERVKTIENSNPLPFGGLGHS